MTMVKFWQINYILFHEKFIDIRFMSGRRVATVMMIWMPEG
jgi:hypothetical protein